MCPVKRKKFLQVKNFILSSTKPFVPLERPPKRKVRRDDRKICEPGEKIFGMQLNLVLFQLYESYEIKFPAKILLLQWLTDSWKICLMTGVFHETGSFTNLRNSSDCVTVHSPWTGKGDAIQRWVGYEYISLQYNLYEYVSLYEHISLQQTNIPSLNIERKKKSLHMHMHSTEKEVCSTSKCAWRNHSF